jgi:hypothetical protein
VRVLLQIVLVILGIGLLAAIAKGVVPVVPALGGAIRLLTHPLVLIGVVGLVLLVRMRPRRGRDRDRDLR